MKWSWLVHFGVFVQKYEKKEKKSKNKCGKYSTFGTLEVKLVGESMYESSFGFKVAICHF